MKQYSLNEIRKEFSEIHEEILEPLALFAIVMVIALQMMGW
ncbi:MAG: hypothetical protein NUV49_00895 [Patescibacteria group bacterium]|nr:hypothetical protein [Patescibacteria group bacterium]